MGNIEPCAYCNAQPATSSKPGTSVAWWSVRCLTPYCAGHQTRWYASAAKAGEVWNSWQRQKRQILAASTSTRGNQGKAAELTVRDHKALLDGFYVGDFMKTDLHPEWVLWPSTLSAEFTASDLRAIADELDWRNGEK
jgi:hypothetical protein